MTVRRAARVLPVLALLVAGAARSALAAEDRVLFANGNEMTGVVEAMDDREITLRVGERLVRIPRRNVRDVVLAPGRSGDSAPGASVAEVARKASESAAPESRGAAPEGAAPRSPQPAPAPAAAEGAAPAATGPAAKPPAAAPSSAAAPERTGSAAAGTKPATAPAADASLLARFLRGTDAERTAAAAELVAGWPDTKPTLDAALAAPTEIHRIAAASLFLQPGLGDRFVYAVRFLDDTSPVVRRIGVRLARHDGLKTFEPRLIRLLAADPDVNVRFEAVRALEELGTVRCLPEILAGWERAEDEKSKRRYRRVLRRITGEEHGDDAAGWRAAVDAARKRAEQAPAAK